MTLGTAAALLDTLVAVEPLHFASFYQRTRFYRGATKPAPPELVLDLTQDCPLTCGFCLAGATRGGGLRISDATLAELETELHGVPKVLVVGGEPLTHPEIDGILRRLRANHAEVEVVTGGVTLPPEPLRFGEWLRRRTVGEPQAGGLTLTLSVDRWHREAVGDALFAARLDRMLELADQLPAGLSVRFLVTDPALPTVGYLQKRDIEACLATLHGGLRARFDRAWRDHDVDTWFRFGPVVRLGEAAEMDGEPLDAADMALAAEVVVSPRSDKATYFHSSAKALGHTIDPLGLASTLLDLPIKLLRGLPATWMAEIPTGLVYRRAERGSLAERLLHGVIADALGLNDHPGLHEAFLALHFRRMADRDQGNRYQQLAIQLLQATGLASARRLTDALQAEDPQIQPRAIACHAALTVAEQWPERREPWLTAMAQRIDEACHPALAWQIGVDRPKRRVHVPVVRRLWQLRAERDPVFAAALAEELVRACLQPLGSGGWPIFEGYQPRRGLLTDRPDAPVPLRQAPLDLGVDTPFFGDSLVHPRLVLRAGLEPPCGRPVVALDGLGATPFGAEDQSEALDAFRELAKILAQLTPTSLREKVADQWQRGLLALAELPAVQHQVGLAASLRLCASEALPGWSDLLESPADIAWLVDSGRSERAQSSDRWQRHLNGGSA